MTELGTRGIDIQQQVKQAMAASVLWLDDDDNVKNKKLIDQILPHEDKDANNEFIRKCVARRKMLELYDDPEHFCNDEQKHVTPSCVCSYLCL